jgi:O-antigen/teichoic acid export membrane protein
VLKNNDINSRAFKSARTNKVEDSLKKRYLYKIISNFVGLGASMITQTIIPRALGPASYGSFSFLTEFFRQVVGFFDAGTSLGFYSKLSQRPREPALIRFYWAFAGLIGIVVIILVQAIFSIGLGSRLWLGQETLFIFLAAIWALLTWYIQIISNIVDAYGQTVGGEIARIAQKIFSVGLILLMYWCNRFSLTEYFAYHYVIMLFLSYAFWRVLRASRIALFPRIKPYSLAIKRYTNEFYKYSSPLLMMSVFVLIFAILDRWLLQRVAGSVEQGFYGLSYQIGAICFMFTSAMTVLLMREFSKAFGNQDLEHMRTLFKRYIPMLYSIAAFFGVFVALQADRISWIFGGTKFHGAARAISLMALYPIHQTYGQLTGSLLLATGQTKRYRDVNIGIGFLGLPILFWLIGPKHWFGLELGATGLAIKMVLVNFIGVNLLLFYCARFLHLSFFIFLRHQGYSFVLLAGAAVLATTAVNLLIHKPIIAFLLTGAAYSLESIGIALLFPQVFGVTRTELVRSLAQLRSRLAVALGG